MARKAASGDYTSPESKSPYQLLEDWIEVVEKYPEEVGLDVDETIQSNEGILKTESEAADAAEISVAEPATIGGQLIRIVNPATSVTADGAPYREDEDPINPKKLNIENIIQKDGLEVYKDQAGRLWTGLATYWIKRGEFDRAKAVFEKGMKSVLTIRDFSQVFDAYAEFGQSILDAMMASLADEVEDEDAAETERELDAHMKAFEELADRRPFLHNDVLLRRNPNDVQEWEKRVALWGDDDEQVSWPCSYLLTTLLMTIEHYR